MIIIYLALAALAAGLFIARFLVPLVASPTVLDALGPFRAGVLGIAICATIGIIAFFVLNLDHLPLSPDPRPRFWEAAQLTGFTAIFWMPIYLAVFSRARRQTGGQR